jgi:serine/threonine protein kinase
VREASADARIGNPHIAETFDAGRLETGEPYILMEFLEGETLDRRLTHAGPFAPEDLIDLVGQACKGIQAAHEAGIVHRDLKPENLFVTTRDGKPFVKILDFGISKFDAGRTGVSSLTATGSTVGTPYYMSPEQVRGERSIDARTDVYALGVILYECASGVRPYDARAIEPLVVLIHEGKAVPLRERRPALSQDFCDIVHRAMAVERDERFHTARSLSEALASLRDGVHRATGPSSNLPPAGVVVRPSNRPVAERQSPPHPVPTPVVPDGRVDELGPTLASAPPSPPMRRPRWGLLVGAGSLLAGGSAIFVALARPEAVVRPRDVPDAGAFAISRVRDDGLPTAEPVALPSTVDTSTAKVSPQTSSGKWSTRSADSGVARPLPSATSTQHSRAEQDRLLQNNPFGVRDASAKP